MTVEHVEALVEEPSMEEVLRLLMPKLLPPQTTFQIHPYQGKPDLLNKLPARLRGYAKWRLPKGHHIVVVVDRDSDDCKILKKQLNDAAPQSGVAVLNRIAIEELEAWYFGDWKAVRKAYPRVPKNIPTSAKYRDPDAIKGGTCEAFERVLQEAGYFTGGLRKREAARAIAGHMEPSRNVSRSFCALRDGLAHWASSARL